MAAQPAHAAAGMMASGPEGSGFRFIFNTELSETPFPSPSTYITGCSSVIQIPHMLEGEGQAKWTAQRIRRYQLARVLHRHYNMCNPPPLFGAKFFHCTGHCAGRTFFGKKTLAGHCLVTPNHQNMFRIYTTNKPYVIRDMSYPSWYMHANTAEGS